MVLRDQYFEKVTSILRKKIKPEALKQIPLEMIEEAVNRALTGCTAFDLAVVKKYSCFFCKKCGECCRRCDPIDVDLEDVSVIAFFLGVEPYVVIANYTKQLKSGRLSLKTPCVFLEGNNLCSIYDARPKMCRLFPFVLDGRKKEVTLGLYPYCELGVNVVALRAFGFLMRALMQRYAPELDLELEKYADKLTRDVPQEQIQQIPFFEKMLEKDLRKRDGKEHGISP